jgi:AAA15 family ATPase/GTPase
MLVYFSAENFRSFKDPLELNMRAAPRLQRHRNHVVTVDFKPFPKKPLKLLRSAVIYGANASGKSNVIKAMDFAKQMILGTLNDRKKINVEPFLLSNKVENNSQFYFEFIMGQFCYAYGFKLNNEIILEESLYILSQDDFCVFERTFIDGGHSFKTDFEEQEGITESILSEFVNLIKYTADNKLFLTEAYDKNIFDKLNIIGSVFHLPFMFFSDKLTIIFPESKYVGMSLDLEENSYNKCNYIDVLKTFDTGVSEIELGSVALSSIPDYVIKDVSEKLTSKDGCYTFKFNNVEYSAELSENDEVKITKLVSVHELPNGERFKFDLFNESDGTKRLLDLLPALCGSDEDMNHDYNHVYVIDEFDRSLHPNLSKSFLSTFLDGGVSVKGDQLIVTTHEAGLLDNDLLRRDEIWFVQKELDQSSYLYSLNDYNTRFDKDIQKAYLSGKFGAVPYLMSDYEKTPFIATDRGA